MGGRGSEVAMADDTDGAKAGVFLQNLRGIGRKLLNNSLEAIRNASTDPSMTEEDWYVSPESADSSNSDDDDGIDPVIIALIAGGAVVVCLCVCGVLALLTYWRLEDQRKEK